MSDNNKEEELDAIVSKMDSETSTEVIQQSRALERLIDLNERQQVHEPTCLLCNSPHRQKLEDEWDDSGESIKAVQDLWKKLNSSHVGKSAVEMHFFHHIRKEIREIQKVEYINKLNNLKGENQSSIERIKLYLAAVDERILGINSVVPEGDLDPARVEQLKSSEMVKLMGSAEKLIKLLAQITGEMAVSGDLVTIPKSAFIEVFTKALVEAKNDREKEVINGILESLGDLAQSMD